MNYRDESEIARFLATRAGSSVQQQKASARRLLDQLNATPQPSAPPYSPIQADQIHPPSDVSAVQSMMAPSRWLVLPEAPIVPAGTESAGIRLEFSAGGGWLIGMRGISVDEGPPGNAGQFEQAQLGMRLTLNDGENLITNGVAADFASFSTLFADAVHWSPILRRVDVKDVMIARFRNFNPPASGINLTPRVTFAFWRDRYPGT